MPKRRTRDAGSESLKWDMKERPDPRTEKSVKRRPKVPFHTSCRKTLNIAAAGQRRACLFDETPITYGGRDHGSDNKEGRSNDVELGKETPAPPRNEQTKRHERGHLGGAPPRRATRGGGMVTMA